MEKLNLKEGIYLHVVTSLSSLDFGTCLILCSFSWLKWFKIWHSKGRFCSCLGYRTGSSVLTHTPTGWWNLDGGLHNCQLTTAACNSRGESKNLFYCWHAAVPNTMRLVWTSYSVHPRSFTYAVPSGMPIFIRSWLSSSGKVFTSSWRAWNHLDKESPTEIWDILRPCIFLDQWWSMMINDG